MSGKVKSNIIERKLLKSKAKKVVKANYWRIIAVCFVVAFVTGSYSEVGTMSIFSAKNEKAGIEKAVENNISKTGNNNLQVIENIIKSINNEENQEKSEKDQAYQEKFNRGAFALLFNNITDSNSIVFGVLNIVNEGLFKGKLVSSLLMVIGTIIMVAFWFFIQNLVQVGQSRFFMETTFYDDTLARRVLLPVTVKRWVRSCTVMFFTSVYQFFWTLTIIGGFIKVQSYRMVPYIVAENPDIKHKDAITLSRKMMNGYKWQAFKMDLSFIGWGILGILSFGLVSIFYVNPYRTATETQFYFDVRQRAIKNKLANYELLNDKYLVEQPIDGKEVLNQYPSELFSLPELRHKEGLHTDYMRKYSIWSIILLFVIFSVIGWIWEVSLHLLQGSFVNRGVLHGPWLPIYGSGGVLVLVLLKKVRQKPWLTFILTVVVCGILEYTTSWYLETFKGHKWWDYSGYFLNLNGRICAEGLLVFGLGGCAFIYIFAPRIDDWIEKIPLKIQIMLCAILMGLFITDQVYSSKHPNTGAGVTDYTMQNEEIEEPIKRGLRLESGEGSLARC